MKLGPLGPFLDRIRSQARALERAPGAAVEARAQPGDAKPEGPPTGTLDWVLAEVAAIPQDAPDRRRRAFRAFLQATLSRELGIRDAASPGCQELVDRVLEAMEGQNELRASMEQAVELLETRARRTNR